jgi:hypothetical protein
LPSVLQDPRLSRPTIVRWAELSTLNAASIVHVSGVQDCRKPPVWVHVPGLPPAFRMLRVLAEPVWGTVAAGSTAW